MNTSDHRLASFLQRQLATNPSIFGKMNGDRELLKGLRLCGSQAVRTPMMKPAVFLVKSDESANFTMSQHCHSTWACPYCTPRIMAAKGSDIAVQIDALAKWKGEHAFMVTFTLPHLPFMSIYATYTILLQAWDYFSRRNKGQKKYVRKDTGEVVTYNLNGNLPQFKRDLQIKNMVRVYEFTWGINSWHPHIHALMWTPKQNWNKVLGYEQMLRKSWWHAVKKFTTKYYVERYPDDPEKAQKILSEIFLDYKQGDRALWISKDKHGKLILQKSSHYISGWTGDMELTGSPIKRAQFGHYNPEQILRAAYFNRNFPQIRDDLLKLYIEYAVATKGHRRVEFANKAESKKLRDAWKRTNEYIMSFKKKAMAKAKKQLVCWFNAQEWSHLSWLELTIPDVNIKATLLEHAMEPDFKQKISTFLEQYDIKCHFEPYTSDEVMQAILTYHMEREHAKALNMA